MSKKKKNNKKRSNTGKPAAEQKSVSLSLSEIAADSETLKPAPAEEPLSVEIPPMPDDTTDTTTVPSPAVAADLTAEAEAAAEPTAEILKPETTETEAASPATDAVDASENAAEQETEKAKEQQTPPADVPLTPPAAMEKEEEDKETPATVPAAEKSLSAEDISENHAFAFVGEHTENPYNNVFLASLEEVTADDLGTPPKKKKKTPAELLSDVMQKLIFWAALAVFFYSGYQVVYKLYAYREADDLYSDVANMVFSESYSERDDLVLTAKKSKKMQTLTPINGVRDTSGDETTTSDTETYNELLEMMKGQLSILQKKNPEVIGWIRMEGDTEVNYPITQHSDNDYYLHYAYDGTYNPAGSIFLDYKNGLELNRNRHSVIYGHNMESGSPMFANLLHYQDEGFLDNNRYIEIYTTDALYTYEVFSAYECSSSMVDDENHAWRMNFNNDSEVFLTWVSAIRARSDISSDLEVGENDRVLTLSTCTNANDHRYVVHAKLISVEK